MLAGGGPGEVTVIVTGVVPTGKNPHVAAAKFAVNEPPTAPTGEPAIVTFALLEEAVNGAMPPVTVNVTAPPPVQFIDPAVGATTTDVGLVTVTPTVTVLPEASLTCTVAEPTAIPVTVTVPPLAPTDAGETVAIKGLLDVILYGGLPPVMVKLTGNPMGTDNVVGKTANVCNTCIVTGVPIVTPCTFAETVHVPSVTGAVNVPLATPPVVWLNGVTVPQVVSKLTEVPSGATAPVLSFTTAVRVDFPPGATVRGSAVSDEAV